MEKTECTVFGPFGQRGVPSERVEAELAALDFCDGAVFVSDGERKIFVTAGLSVRPPKGATVVSCGMSERDSVSVSSVAEGSAMISVRRALPVLGGGEACVQEIAVRRRVDTDVLALRAASLLCIGIPPEDLGKLL